MRSTFMILSAIALCTLIVVFTSLTSGRAQSTPLAGADSEAATLQAELTGKIVVTYRPEGTTVGIENAKLRTVAGRRFLTGTVAESVGEDSAALKGSTVNAAWDSLSDFLVLTPQQYKKWLDAYSE